MSKQSNIKSFCLPQRLQNSATVQQNTASHPSDSTTNSVSVINCGSGGATGIGDSFTPTEKLDTSDSTSASEEESTSSGSIKRKKKYPQKYTEKYSLQFKWLINENGLNYCKYCKKFISGSQTHLKRHESRSFHQKMLKAVKFTPDIRSYRDDKVDERKTFMRKVKECELKLTMLIVEHNLPIFLMDHLPKLLASAAPDSEILKTISCARTKVTGIIHNFKEESESNISAILKDTRFSVIIDETTDISVKKCLAILVRYTDIRAEAVRDRLLSLVEVTDLTAEGILQAVLAVLSKLDIPLQNLMGFAADNASVMMGKHAGVQAKLRQVVNENIFVVGCICHSLHLCASAAAMKLPREIEDFVRDIYNYLSCSSKRLGEYQEFQEYVNVKLHALLRPSQTRWLSLEAVVKRTLEQWPALLLFFNAAVLEDNLAAATRIHSALHNIIYKLYLSFLAYVLPLITKMNLLFQSEKAQLCYIYRRIEVTCKVIYKNFMKSEYVDRHSFLKIDPSNVREYKDLDRIYLGSSVDIILQTHPNLDINDVHTFKLNCLSYYVELTNEMKKRFLFLESFRCFECLSAQVALTNDSSVTELLIQFPHIAENRIEEISSEYRELCNLPEEVKQKLLKLDFEEFWFNIFRMQNSVNEKCYNNICQFVFILMCFPHSSACAERIFSTLNNIKTKNRNRLLPTTCDALLQGRELLDRNKCFQWTPSCELVNKKINYQ